MAHEDVVRVLESGLQTILARELRISGSELEFDRPFAELGLNSVMAMSIRREAEQLVGIELSATMLWNHPTIEALAAHLAEKLSPPESPDVDGTGVEELGDSESSVLDSLFDSVESDSVESDSVESSPAGVEGGL
jgi:phthiocerol/phenolphthiocerol synthesis type-I polyketide synthase A